MRLRFVKSNSWTILPTELGRKLIFMIIISLIADTIGIISGLYFIFVGIVSLRKKNKNSNSYDDQDQKNE